MPARRHDPEEYSRFIRKLAEEAVLLAIVVLLGGHGVLLVYKALFPGEKPQPPAPLLKGIVRTSDNLPVRKAALWLAPDGKPGAETALAVNEAGYFEGACPPTGVYRVRVVIDGHSTGARPLVIQGCADTLYEISVKRLPAAVAEVALAAR